MLEGLAKHQTAFDRPDVKKGFAAKHPSLEAQIANLADEITYYSHDLDDGLDSGLLSETELFQEVRFWAHAARLVKKEHGNLPDECRRYFIIRTIIDLQIKDVVETSERLIGDAGVQSADDVRRCPKALVKYSAERRKLNLELRRYLYKNLYFNPRGERAAHPGEAAFAGPVPFLFAAPGGNRRASPAPDASRRACTASCATTSPA